MPATSIPQPNPLKRWRTQHDVTQAQLAVALDVHFTVVSQWEQRRCVPTLARFNQLVIHTRLPVRQLLHFFVGDPGAPDGFVSPLPVRENGKSRTR